MADWCLVVLVVLLLLLLLCTRLLPLSDALLPLSDTLLYSAILGQGTSGPVLLLCCYNYCYY